MLRLHLLPYPSPSNGIRSLHFLRPNQAAASVAFGSRRDSDSNLQDQEESYILPEIEMKKLRDPISIAAPPLECATELQQLSIIYGWWIGPDGEDDGWGFVQAVVDLQIRSRV
ncbi:hypothetical protein ZOSMA_74G00470 [Zostera marina]|uniref:Uncharacterized protein n=1 Tax=Zostera marina TaxID=29655 RepID=A0A0K9NPM9_ZOSMR|nr:hypothetical protein ZOSMA_74G00470 [Zostera marina]